MAEIKLDYVNDATIKKGYNEITTLLIETKLTDFNDLDTYFEKIIEKENLIEFKTKETKVKGVKKDCSLYATVDYIKNLKNGLIYIKTNKNYEYNIDLDIKVRLIPISEYETKIYVKSLIKIDFGFSSIINKIIKKIIETKITKLLELIK